MDKAHQQADKDLNRLSKRIKKEYQTAQKEIIEKANAYFEEFEQADKRMFKMVDTGKISRDNYIEWRKVQLAQGDKWRDTIKAISRDYANIQAITADMTNEHMDYVYANNYNYGTYEIEEGLGISTNYTLYNKDTVRELLIDNPQLLPKPDPNKVIKKAERWNMQKVNSALLQGILQGDSIGNIAKRLRRVTDMNIGSSIRNARTMTTRAENSGRLQAYQRAKDMGIDVKKVWVASLDGRTRDSHRALDGETVGLDEEFSNKLMYPSDPDGAPREVYNCRCTMIALPFGFSKGDFLDERISSINYDEWKKAAQERLDKSSKDSIPKVTNKKEAFESLKKTFTDVDDGVLKLNEKLLVDNVNRFNELNARFNVVPKDNGSYFSVKNSKHIAYISGGYTNDKYELCLSNNYFKKIDVYLDTYDKGQINGFDMPSSATYKNTYTITHEYGHMVEKYVSRQRTDFTKIDAGAKNIASRLKEYDKEEKRLAEEIRDEVINIAKNNNTNFSLEDNLSKYGHTNNFEFFAEAFANSQCGKPNELGIAMQQWLKKEGF